MTDKKKTPLGVHMLLDLVEAPFATLDDPLRVKGALLEAVREVHARVLSSQLHRLQPQGVTGVVVISESHLAIHTWPERGEAAIDLFTCGDPERGRAAIRLVAKRLGGRERQLKEVIRGPVAE